MRKVTMGRDGRPVAVTVSGEEREGFRRDGEGLFVPGHDLNHGDVVTVDGVRRRILEMRRVVETGEALTLVLASRPIREL